MKEIDQSDCKNQYGHAEPMTTILGVYMDRAKAERELKRLIEEDRILVEETDCDPTFFTVEERPVLE